MNQIPRSKPILITLAIFTSLGILLGGAALADYIDVQLIGLATLLLTAARGGLDFYLSGTNVSAPQVVATQTQPGAPVVAGQASAVSTGHTIHPSLSMSDVAAALPDSPAPPP